MIPIRHTPPFGRVGISMWLAFVLLSARPAQSGASTPTATAPSGAELLRDARFADSRPDGTPPDSGFWRPSWAGLEAGGVCTTSAGRSDNGLWEYTGVAAADAWVGFYQEASTAPGDQFRGSAWMRTPPGQGWVRGSRAVVRLLFLDAGGATLAQFESPGLTSANTDWRHVEVVTDSAPAGTKLIRFVLYLEKPRTVGQSIVNFDDASLVRENAATSPRILRQPVARTVVNGGALNLSVEATGVLPLTYQWRRNALDLAGENRSTLERESVTTADAGEYAVEVRDGNGARLVSDPATVSVMASPVKPTGLFVPGLKYGQGARKVCMADFDGDGDLDLLTGDGSTAWLWVNDGSGGFTRTTSFGNGSSWAVAAGDVNGDGAIDVLVYGEQAMRLWLNDGTGHFTDSGQGMGFGLVRSALLVDVDRDGDLDLVLAIDGSPSRVWINDGSGHFTDSGQRLGHAANHSFDVAALDLDRDGDVDLVFANFDLEETRGGGLHLFINDGHGRFAERGDGFGDPTAWYGAVAAGDLDGDGAPDLFTASASVVEVWHNVNGELSRTQQFSTLVQAWDATLVDIDGDGDLDVVTGDAASQASIMGEIWLNVGGGRLLNSGRHLCCGSGYGVAAGDIDGDGDPDLVFAGSTAALWLNQDASPLIELEALPRTGGFLKGTVRNLSAYWTAYYRLYVAGRASGRGWTTIPGCGEFTSVGPDGRFQVTVGGDVDEVAVFLVPTGAGVTQFACVQNAAILPAELQQLSLARSTTGGLRLSIEPAGEQVRLSWPGAGTNLVLEAAMAVDGPWAESRAAVQVAADRRVAEVSVGADRKQFFRLRQR